MARAFTVVVNTAARSERDAFILYYAMNYGDGSADRIQTRIDSAITGLDEMPRRHTRVAYLRDRLFEYRRVLVGKKHRVIYTVDDERRLVEVVRVDLQSNDPASLDDLP